MRLVFWLTCLGLALVPVSARAQAARWQIGSAPTFSSGTYGADAPTNLYYNALTARRLFDAGDLTLVLPVLCITGNGSVTVVGGTPVRTDPSSSTPAAGSTLRTTNAGRDAGVQPTTPQAGAATATTTACGFGDVVVRGRYYLLDERGWLPTVALLGHVKTPTASAARGLGTGRPDEGIGVEVSRSVGERLLVMVDGGYTLIGQPSGVEYRNRWWYDVGLSRRFGRLVDVSLFYEDYGSVVERATSARDVLVALGVRGSSGWRVDLTGQFGLSDGAAERGVTVGASRRF
jgi:Putative MetA-pathway of phenol degradation